MVRLRDGSEVRDPRLGRIPAFDERSRGFPVRAALGPQQQIEVTRLWHLSSTSHVLDQGRMGSCVGMGVTNDLRYTPRPVPGLTEEFAVKRIYWPAQQGDEWPGGSYPGADPVYEGTSVLAGIKAAAALGYYKTYRWAFSEADLALAVGHLGPSIIGVPWFEGMLEADAGGYLRLTGEVIGGHCVCVIGISLSRDDYTIAQSWGPDWNAPMRGRARITRAAMAMLLRQDGEAAVITERATPRVATG